MQRRAQALKALSRLLDLQNSVVGAQHRALTILGVAIREKRDLDVNELAEIERRASAASEAVKSTLTDTRATDGTDGERS